MAGIPEQHTEGGLVVVARRRRGAAPDNRALMEQAGRLSVLLADGAQRLAEYVADAIRAERTCNWRLRVVQEVA